MGSRGRLAPAPSTDRANRSTYLELAQARRGKDMSDMRSVLARDFRARCPLFFVQTAEEIRAKAVIAEAATDAGYLVRYWSSFDGVTDPQGAELAPGLTDAVDVLREIQGSSERAVWVLLDFHQWLDPVTIRGLRSVSQKLLAEPRDSARSIVVLGPVPELPPELEGQSVVVDFPLPDREDVERLLSESVDGLPEEMRAAAVGNGSRQKVIDAALGLGSDQIGTSFARSLVVKRESNVRRIDPQEVAAEKESAVSKSPAVEWMRPIEGGFANVGGLQRVKSFATRSVVKFSQEAREYGLPGPKGMLLTGVSGCGKSWAAKCLAGEWGLPLVRIDCGAAKSKYVGESEQNFRQGQKIAETIAPCVCLIDEIEKAFGGASGPQGDGGVASDQLGAFLTWMQEREGSVFVVATANDVSGLPPELMRKGRFDDVFFVDLPTATERLEILETTVRQFAREPETVGDLSGIVQKSEGWSGAELAAIVPEGMLTAYLDGKREPVVADLEAAMDDVVPLSQTAKEKVEALRKWAVGRARPASDLEAKKKNQGRSLDIDTRYV